MKKYPVVWIIGKTRSSKSHLAKGLSLGERAGLNLPVISTSTFFRDQHGQPDTYSRQFVFNLSASASQALSVDPDCNVNFLKDELERVKGPCIIEGERNPVEFSKLYDPKADLVFFLDRSDMEEYDTTIEGSIPIIEDIVRWNIVNGITPENKVRKLYFGDKNLRATMFNQADNSEREVVNFLVGPKTAEVRYPWIRPMIDLTAELIVSHFGNHVMNMSMQARLQI